MPLIQSRAELTKYLQAGNKVEYLHFWGHTRNDSNVINASCLSQWYPQSFSHEGTEYATAEHFMMAGKARLFADAQTCEQILAATTPAEAKKLGRQVKNFDSALWNQHKVDIVTTGNIAGPID